MKHKRKEREWYECRAVVCSSLGLHARPASDISDYAAGYKGEVTIQKNDTTADAKTVMELMMLQAFRGCELTIRVERGERDSETALYIKNYLESTQ